MTLKKITSLLAIAIFMGFSTTSCNKEEGNNETKISSHGKTESHNMGQNCMICHVSGGDGEGWFTVAGTVYNEALNTPLPNGTARLYTGPNATGTLRATIEVDGNGNFYTTESVDFSGGLYPSVEGNTSTQHMSSKATMGQCNSCHGATNDRIWTK